MNYKKIAIELIIYTFIILTYTLLLQSNYEFFIAMFYLNNLFFVTIILLINTYIPKNKNLELEIYKYKSKLNYFLKRTVTFTKNAFLILVSLLIINSLILSIYGYQIEITNGIYYTLNYFIIFIIMYLLISCFTFSKYYSFIKELIVCIFIIMYVLCQSNSTINVFKYIMNFGTLFNLLFFYSKYIIIILIILNYAVKKGEIQWYH